MEVIEDVTYGRFLSPVKQMSRLHPSVFGKEPENESIGTRLSSLLNAFRTDELSLDTIDMEVETVRQQIYDREKFENQSHL